MDCAQIKSTSINQRNLADIGISKNSVDEHEETIREKTAYTSTYLQRRH